MKYFRMSYEEVVYKRSYINLILLNAAIPGMKPISEDKEDEYENSHPKKYQTDDNGNSFLSSLI